MIIEINKLDNPAWHSLTETHQNFAIEYPGMKFYHPDFCPFGGFVNVESSLHAIDRYSLLVNNFYVIGNKPRFSKNVKINKELVCNQMVPDTPCNIEISESIIELQEIHKDDLFGLVNLVQPGYFKKETSQLGSYYGIYKNRQLIAVTGERLKMNSYTEVSAVVTHPDYTGKGYAKQLVAHTANKIFSENKIPYLHVAESNTGAISLYEKLGFRLRRKISFWNLIIV